jgi:hypothetical protein
LHGLSNLEAGAFGKGAGLKWYTGNDYWLRGSVGYFSNQDDSKLSGSAGLFKQLYSTTNTAFSIGAELSGETSTYSFGVVGNVEWLPWTNIGLSVEDALVYTKESQVWQITPGGNFILAVYF